MPMLLLLGGARSGKSALAQDIAVRAGVPVTVIATAEALDDEMRVRIARHRADRPVDWTTVEEPIDLSGAVGAAPPADLVVVDCLTLWVSNLVGGCRSDDLIVRAAATVADELSARPSGAVVVSNEVGLGVVPANPAARTFRDTLGSVNAIFAARADRAALLVAGRAHELTSTDRFLEGIPWLQRRPSST
jgi:adenosylcobinamide kinase / adenosylcobinamide-phosphate guanylyltransferase